MDQMVWFRENWHEEVRRAKVPVLCVSDFVATCVFSGSDGEKIIQVVVKIHVSLFICVKTSWRLHLLHECVMPPGHPDGHTLADPKVLS